MADNKINDLHATGETTDRGMFDFMKKKEDSEGYKTPEEAEVVTSGVEKMHLSESECKEEEKKHGGGGLLEKLHRFDSSSSSSDEEGDDEEKKKKRKETKEKKAGLKEKIEEKLGGHKEEHDYNHGDSTNVPIEKVNVQENVYSEPSYPAHQEGDEEKKGGFLDKIKDKLPGKTKADEHEVPAPAPVPVSEPCVEGDKEKKGFLDKIKEKIPGFHPKSDAQEEKDHD